jgi:hypothetical protein
VQCEPTGLALRDAATAAETVAPAGALRGGEVWTKRIERMGG